MPTILLLKSKTPNPMNILGMTQSGSACKGLIYGSDRTSVLWYDTKLHLMVRLQS